jgi:four helix bundle protein
MHNVNQLTVWNKALDLAEEIYNVTESFPPKEVWGLSSQMRRAAVSIGSNIAEGAGRNSNREFYHFLGIANGSANELIFQIELSCRRLYLDDKSRIRILDNIDHIKRMNCSLQKRMQIEIDRNNRKSAT